MTVLVTSTGELEEPLRRLVPGKRLFLELHEGLGGAWTELRGTDECILFGYPAHPTTLWFRVFDPPPTSHNAVTQALERMIFARGISTVLVTDPAMLATVKKGASAHPAVRISAARGSETPGEFLRRAIVEDLP